MRSKGYPLLQLFSYWLFFSRLQPIIGALGRVLSLEKCAISAELKETHRWRQKQTGSSNRIPNRFQLVFV